MKRILIFGLLAFLGLGLWWGGNKIDKWDVANKLEQQRAEASFQERTVELRAFPDKIKKVDREIDRGKLKDAQKEITELLKDAPSEFVGSLKYREAEIKYRLCKEYVANFIFFATTHTDENPTYEQAGEERDKATVYCNKAMEILNNLKAQTKEEEFYYQYGRGNLEVRRALLAASQEELTAALNRAKDAYVKALVAKDDYQAKFNLELLIKQLEESGGAGQNPVDQLRFLRPGAGPGKLGKSKL